MKRFLLLLLILAVAQAACDSGTDPDPTMADVAGTYAATELVTTSGGTSTDQLAEGAEVTITLATDATTRGTLFVPGGNEDGSDYTASLEGTWSLTSNTVTFDHDAETFLRNMFFTYEDDRLSADAVFGTTQILVTLTRQ